MDQLGTDWGRRGTIRDRLGPWDRLGPPWTDRRLVHRAPRSDPRFLAAERRRDRGVTSRHAGQVDAASELTNYTAEQTTGDTVLLRSGRLHLHYHYSRNSGFLPSDKV